MRVRILQAREYVSRVLNELVQVSVGAASLCLLLEERFQLPQLIESPHVLLQVKGIKPHHSRSISLSPERDHQSHTMRNMNNQIRRLSWSLGCESLDTTRALASKTSNHETKEQTSPDTELVVFLRRQLRRSKLRKHLCGVLQSIAQIARVLQQCNRRERQIRSATVLAKPAFSVQLQSALLHANSPIHKTEKPWH